MNDVQSLQTPCHILVMTGIALVSIVVSAAVIYAAPFPMFAPTVQ